jgi:hypothetical protein
MQKDHSALRDDVHLLFDRLCVNLRGKETLLGRIHSNESDKRYFLKSGAVQRLSESMDSDQALLDEIGSLNYEAAQITNSICRTCGLSPAAFERMISECGERKFREVFVLRGSIMRLLNEISVGRNLLIHDMKRLMKRIGADYTSLVAGMGIVIPDQEGISGRVTPQINYRSAASVV